MGWQRALWIAAGASAARERRTRTNPPHHAAASCHTHAITLHCTPLYSLPPHGPSPGLLILEAARDGFAERETNAPLPQLLPTNAVVAPGAVLALAAWIAEERATRRARIAEELQLDHLLNGVAVLGTGFHSIVQLGPRTNPPLQ